MKQNKSRKCTIHKKCLPVKNDWVLQLQKDLLDCNITLSEESVKNMKKERFKSLVVSKIKNLSKEYLISLRSRHSKSQKLMHLDTAKKYLLSDEISTDEKKLLFALKTRAVNVKTN